MQIFKHIPEKRNFSKRIFTNKYQIKWNQPQNGYIKIGEMIGNKNELLAIVQKMGIFNLNLEKQHSKKHF